MKTLDSLRVALIQADLVWENPIRNRLNFEQIILSLIGKADVVFLPETFTTGFTTTIEKLSEEMEGPTVFWLKELSNKTKIAIGGSIYLKEGELYFNRFVFVTPEGELSFYDKRHLFSIGGESNLIKSGANRVVISYLGWRIAPFICYDLRFPVWCRNRSDIDLMVFVANWPEPRKEVWKVLLRARAIENQVFVAGVNRIGIDGNRIGYNGDSQLVTARGEIAEPIANLDPRILLYELSKSVLHDFRVKFPVDKDADQFLIT